MAGEASVNPTSWITNVTPDGPELGRELATVKGAADSVRRSIEELRGELLPVLIDVPRDTVDLAKVPDPPGPVETPIGRELRELWVTLSSCEHLVHSIRNDLRM